MKYIKVIYNKILDLLSSSSSSNQRMSVEIYNPYNPSPEKVAVIAPKGILGPGMNPYPAHSQQITQEALQTRILQLWKKVWLGLYQVHDTYGPYHFDRITALSSGAGLKKIYGIGGLEILRQHYYEFSKNSGIKGLELYENLSIGTLRSIVDILEAYEREIVTLEEIYAVLREAQIGLHETRPTEAQTQPVRKLYLSLAEPLERKLTHYENRMEVLKMDIYDEAISMDHHCPRLQRGWSVHQKAFGRPG